MTWPDVAEREFTKRKKGNDVMRANTSSYIRLWRVLTGQTSNLVVSAELLGQLAREQAVAEAVADHFGSGLVRACVYLADHGVVVEQPAAGSHRDVVGRLSLGARDVPGRAALSRMRRLMTGETQSLNVPVAVIGRVVKASPAAADRLADCFGADMVAVCVHVAEHGLVLNRARGSRRHEILRTLNAIIVDGTARTYLNETA